MSRLRFTKYHWLTFLFSGLTILAILLLGLVRQQWMVDQRGLPASLPEPISLGGPALGLNVALEQYSPAETAAVLEEISGLGVTRIKQSFYFPSAGPFDWEAADQTMAAVAAQPELTLTPLLNGDPADQFAPPDKAAFARWAGEFAIRYGDQIDAYIIWDEPNLTTQWGGQPVNAAEYGALLTAAGTAIRQADAGAAIVAAPLAPTTETGPINLADHLYLQALYEIGAQDAFDAVGHKPYGFDTGPGDRQVGPDVLNFSRSILLHEVMVANGDADKAVWSGNWGWNSLPADWTGAPSVWGQTDPQTQIQHLVDGYARAKEEWPWQGVMFIEGWESGTPADNARHGFDLHENPHRDLLPAAIARYTSYATTGFHFADPDSPHQDFVGGWEFSPEFGADMSEVADGALADRVTFTFWGTEAGLRVRRAPYRARFYVTIDGQPANGLPQDENGAALVLTAPDPNEDFMQTVQVASGLAHGPHTMEVVASRGWDQWALNGFAVAYRPDQQPYRIAAVTLAIMAIASLVLAAVSARRANWSDTGLGQAVRGLSDRTQLALTAGAAAVVALAGWFTWGAQLAGIYRRMGDPGQVALVAASAVTFYITPWLFAYLAALLVFFVLVYWRPAWGVAIIAFCFPFYVPQILKPIYNYRFSPVEIFTLVVFAAFVAHQLWRFIQQARSDKPSSWHQLRPGFNRYDGAVLAFFVIATLSLWFTERLNVATNEWRLVILEPVLFYILMRGTALKTKELWTILDAFVLGGVTVALIGLGQYLFGTNLIEAEAGLMRLRSIYGSPNNVALYLGRVLPLLLAIAVLSRRPGRRRWLYAAAILPIGLAILLSFSKGAILLGVPAAVVTIFICWQKRAGRRVWPWLIAFAILGITAYLVMLQIPQLAGRLDPRSATGFFRINLWRASLNMIAENPWFGVGLDNFLYAYRGRYIFDGAWQEPNLNHPHNIFLDLGTRLGLLGLLSGLWLIFLTLYSLFQSVRTRFDDEVWWPVAVGFLAAIIHMVFHGLVDHSFFLVDLAFTFFLILGTAVWLEQTNE